MRGRYSTRCTLDRQHAVTTELRRGRFRQLPIFRGRTPRSQSSHRRGSKAVAARRLSAGRFISRRTQLADAPVELLIGGPLLHGGRPRECRTFGASGSEGPVEPDGRFADGCVSTPIIYGAVDGRTGERQGVLQCHPVPRWLLPGGPRISPRVTRPQPRLAAANRAANYSVTFFG